MIKKIYIVLTVLLIACSLKLSQVFCQQSKDPAIIRVLILDDRKEMSLSLKGRYSISEINSAKLLMEGPYLTAGIKATKDGIRIGKRDINVAGLKVRVLRDSNIYVDGRRFRGAIDILRKDNGMMMVINHVSIDDYLYGVLYHEVSHRWPMEVLKTQAIIARTFALYQARQNKLQPYDLRNDIYSQVYGGRQSEKWSTTRAVNLTKSKVLTYKSDIFPTYYHATCAGFTEDASNLWNIDIPPLKGVKCDYCRHSPYYKWTKEIPLWVLETDLKDNGYRIGKINSFQVLSRNKSGRVDKVEIKDDANTSLILTGKDFRQIIGPNDLRSAKFDGSIKWKSLVLGGNGWGHGVGLCQWGAYGMAKKGKKAEEILRYYYPGTEVMSVDKLKSGK